MVEKVSRGDRWEEHAKIGQDHVQEKSDSPTEQRLESRSNPSRKEIIKVDQTRLMTTSLKEGPHHPSTHTPHHLHWKRQDKVCNDVSFLKKEKEEWTHIKCDGSPLHSLATNSDIHSSLKKEKRHIT